VIKQTFIGLTVLATLSFCKAQDDTDLKIFGGKQSQTGDWPTTVALALGSQGFCTGTLVAPNLVVSAAHCLVDRETDSGSEVTVVLGNTVQTGTPYRVQKIKISPKYRDEATNDIAYLTLTTAINNVPLVEVLADEAEKRQLFARGAPVTLVGFGQNDQGGSNVKFDVETSVVRDQFGGPIAIGGNGKDSCFGDSGGPAYGRLANGELRVFGVVSRGSQNCLQGGLYTKMPDHICWVQQSSGITIPNLKACGNVNNQGSSRLALFLTEGQPAWIASQGSVTSVAICQGAETECRASGRKDTLFTLRSDRTSTKYHRTTAFSPNVLSVYTLLGFDSSGQVVTSRAIRFSAL
jgi:secreted trypsin-like serine protease